VVIINIHITPTVQQDCLASDSVHLKSLLTLTYQFDNKTAFGKNRSKNTVKHG